MRHLYIKACAPSSPQGDSAEQLRTGATTSYNTNDDGDLQYGRDTDWFTLDWINPFGNNARFTGTTGGYKSGGSYFDKDGVGTTYALAFPDDIMIDWSSRSEKNAKQVGFHLLITGAFSPATCVANAASFSVGSWTSGWFLPNRIMLINITWHGSTQVFNHTNESPLNIVVGLRSSTPKEGTAGNYFYVLSSGNSDYSSTSLNFIPARYFTDAELGI